MGNHHIATGRAGQWSANGKSVVGNGAITSLAGQNRRRIAKTQNATRSGGHLAPQTRQPRFAVVRHALGCNQMTIQGLSDLQLGAAENATYAGRMSGKTDQGSRSTFERKIDTESSSHGGSLDPVGDDDAIHNLPSGVFGTDTETTTFRLDPHGSLITPKLSTCFLGRGNQRAGQCDWIDREVRHGIERCLRRRREPRL